MIKILLLCAAGMSTSLLVKKMEAAAKQQQIEVQIDAFAANMLVEKLPEYDAVLIGPQIRFKKDEIAAEAAKQGKRAEVIDPVAYGTMNGAKVLDTALSLIG